MSPSECLSFSERLWRSAKNRPKWWEYQILQRLVFKVSRLKKLGKQESELNHAQVRKNEAYAALMQRSLSFILAMQFDLSRQKNTENVIRLLQGEGVPKWSLGNIV